MTNPENIREGEPYDNPAFEELARAHDVWGRASGALCAVFWMAGKDAQAREIETLRADRDSWRDQASARVADAVEFAELADALRADAARWRYLMSENDVDGYITGAGGAYWERGGASRTEIEAAIDLLAAQPAPTTEAGGLEK